MYPTTPEFNAVFKKDMFLKNNKVGSQQVIYFLLNILDPVKLKQKVTSWPVYVPKIEAQFRNEVMKYLNELNTIYEGSDLPKVMASHLISPGGFKFVKYMLSLSQIVLYQHLKRNSMTGKDMIFAIKPDKDPSVTETYTRCLMNKTKNINEETLETKREFSLNLERYKRSADEVVKKQLEVDVAITKAKERLRQIEEEWKNNLQQPIEFSDSATESLETIQDGLNYLNRIKSKLEEYHRLIKSLHNEDLILKHNLDTDDCGILRHEENSLDLIVLCNNFRKFIDRNKLIYSSANNEIISDNLEWIKTVNEDLKSFLGKHKTCLVKFEELSNRLSETNVSSPTENSSTSILAVPLESPEN